MNDFPFISLSNHIRQRKLIRPTRKSESQRKTDKFSNSKDNYIFAQFVQLINLDLKKLVVLSQTRSFSQNNITPSVEHKYLTNLTQKCLIFTIEKLFMVKGSLNTSPLLLSSTFIDRLYPLCFRKHK